MFDILNNKGTALLGLVVSVLIIALLFFGSFYFFDRNDDAGVNDLRGDNIIDTYDKAQDDIVDINKKIESQNKILDNENKLNN